MSQPPPFGMDLSGLPPEIRQKVEQRLAALTPEARQNWEKSGVAKLARLFTTGTTSAGAVPPPLPVFPRQAAKPSATQPSAWQRPPDGPTRPPAGATEAKPAWRTSQELPRNTRRAIQGHYHDTIRPGDEPGLTRWVIAVAIVLVAVALLFW